MGNYTGLRFKGVVHAEFRNDIAKLMEIQANGEHAYEWKDFANPIVKEYGNFYRSMFIPFGMMSYMPDEWGGDCIFDKNGHCVVDADGHLVMSEPSIGTAFDVTTGVWSFQCSLKNYEGELDYFIEKVVPVLCETVEFCERYYEYDEYSVLYSLENGHMVSRQGIRYND